MSILDMNKNDPDRSGETMVDIELSADCQFCDDVIGQGKYDGENIYYVCSKGHKNVLKGFGGMSL